MEIHDEQIDMENFATFLQKLPQVSVELLVERDNQILLALRENEPAKGVWFVPGSRLYKGETFESAVKRIAKEELSIEVEINGQIGTYNHFWDSGAFQSVKKTHTVNVVYHVNPISDRGVSLDKQHSDFQYTKITNPDMHPYIKQYVEDCGLV